MEQLSPFVDYADYLHTLYTNNFFSVEGTVLENRFAVKSGLLQVTRIFHGINLRSQGDPVS